MNYLWVMTGLIFAAALFVRLYLRWRWLVVVWLAGAALLTGAFCISIYRAGGSLYNADGLRLVALFSVFFVLISGALVFLTNMLVWFVAVFRALPQQTSANEMNDYAALGPVEKLADEHGLSGVLRLYEDLLATHATALGTVRFHPYQAFLADLRNSWDPHYSRQARAFIRHLRRVPNVLPSDLIGAEVVLGKQGELTTAQLSAIEVCHRINLGRLRQRFLVWIPQAVFISAMVGLIPTIEKVSQAVRITWADIWSSIIASGAWRRNWPIFIFPAAGFVVGTILNFITFGPLLGRLQAFGAMLTIAKAYRQAPDKKA